MSRVWARALFGTLRLQALVEVFISEKVLRVDNGRRGHTAFCLLAVITQVSPSDLHEFLGSSASTLLAGDLLLPPTSVLGVAALPYMRPRDRRMGRELLLVPLPFCRLSVTVIR